MNTSDRSRQPRATAMPKAEAYELIASFQGREGDLFDVTKTSRLPQGRTRTGVLRTITLVPEMGYAQAYFEQTNRAGKATQMPSRHFRGFYCSTSDLVALKRRELSY